MDSAGVKAIHFGGRFFNYYIRSKGSPEHAGKDIVAEIPVELDDYQRWLQETRNRFASMTSNLENSVLLVTEDDLVHYPAKDSRKLRTFYGHPHPRHRVDEDLYSLPSPFTFACDHGLYNWLYVIDLDNELFIVDNRRPPCYGKVHFHLSNIPRDQWLRSYKDYGFDFKLCPEAFQSLSTREHFVNIATKQRYQEKYHSYVRRSVKPLTGKMELHQSIGLLLFDRMAGFNVQHWWKHIPDNDPGNFAYREVAFAILSIAAGQFYMEYHRNFDRDYGYKRPIERFDCEREPDGRPRLVPHFGTEFVMPGQTRGSSPPDSITYWLQHVLVQLVSDHVLHSDVEAVAAQAIEFGLASGKSNFLVLLFSIRNAVFLEVWDSRGTIQIRQSDTVAIYGGYQNMSDPRRTSWPVNVGLARMSEQHIGFRTLQNFFTVAASRERRRSRDVYPIDIYSEIIERVDLSTRSSCAGVSPFFYSLCQTTFTFSRQLKLVSVEVAPKVEEIEPEVDEDRETLSYVRYFTPPAPEDRPTSEVDEANLDVFTFRSVETRSTMDYTLCLHRGTSQIWESWHTTFFTSWFPVIGDWDRPSILMQLPLYTKQDLLMMCKPRGTIDDMEDDMEDDMGDDMGYDMEDVGE